MHQEFFLSYLLILQTKASTVNYYISVDSGNIKKTAIKGRAKHTI